MAETIAIRSGRLSARIDPFGAELASLRDADGRELMTDADPAFWSGRAPILFPVVGQPAGDVIRVDGRAWPMRKHGFARHRRFTVTEEAEDRVAMTLADDAETRREYPFAFRLTLEFAIRDTTLTVAAEIANPDANRALPASFGFHPAFAWPLPYGADRAAHRIVFAAPEPAALRVLAGDGTIAAGERASPLASDARTLRLADALFTDDALIWDRLASDRVTYGAGDGPRLAIRFPDTPMLGIWTKPGARFICIEPWHGIADPEGYAGAFRDKPGVFTLPPGTTKRIAMAITLEE